MSNDKRTPGKLHLDQYGHIYGEPAIPVVVSGVSGLREPVIASIGPDCKPCDGSRLTACWNACDGMTDPAAEIAQLKDVGAALLEACRVAKPWLEALVISNNDEGSIEALTKLNAAISKANGGGV